MGNSKTKNNKTNYVLLTILILLFCFTFYITTQYVKKYNNTFKSKANEEIIEIKKDNVKVSIINNKEIEKTISSESFENGNEVIVENINIIEVISNSNENNKVKYDVKYNIIENDFENNFISTSKSEVFVRFAYSFDNENWQYINNVITTNSSNIIPLINNKFDIAGLKTNLNVATNYELSTIAGNYSKMYWKSETIFRNTEKNNGNKKFKANFTIEYKSIN